MKKIINNIFSNLLACLVAFFLVICLIFYIPIDYIKYKKSPYYKKTKEKYNLFAANGIKFDLYNEIIKNNLPIDFIANPDTKSVECGWLVFHKTLIISNVFSFEFNSENGEWNYCVDSEDEKRVILSLDEYISSETEDLNHAIGKDICDRAIVLIGSNEIENAERAESDPRFLVYKDDRIKTLKEFCDNNR